MGLIMSKKLIVFEGIDKSGKSTLSKRLSEYLNWQRIQFPERSTHIGSLIDKYLKKEISLPKEAIHLLFSANRYELKQKILENNTILDRYYFSGIAFSQALKIKEPILKCDEDLPKPDVVIFMDYNGSEIKERLKGEEIYEEKNFLNEVYSYMKNLV